MRFLAVLKSILYIILAIPLTGYFYILYVRFLPLNFIQIVSIVSTLYAIICFSLVANKSFRRFFLLFLLCNINRDGRLLIGSMMFLMTLSISVVHIHNNIQLLLNNVSPRIAIEDDVNVINPASYDSCKILKLCIDVILNPIIWISAHFFIYNIFTSRDDDCSFPKVSSNGEAVINICTHYKTTTEECKTFCFFSTVKTLILLHNLSGL